MISGVCGARIKDDDGDDDNGLLIALSVGESLSLSLPPPSLPGKVMGGMEA